jgi:hypothetical protein
MKEFRDSPAMVGQASRDGGRALQPAPGALGQVVRDAQTLMIGTKVVDTAQDIHTNPQGFRLTSQGASAADQGAEPLAEGGIEPFDVSGVNPTGALSSLDQAGNHLSTALDDAPLNAQLTGNPLFDDLNDGNLRPRSQTGTARLTLARQFRPKGALKSPDVAAQAIHSQQQGPTQSHRSDLVCQVLNKGFVSVGANRSPQPQASGDHHRQGHPDGATLRFDLDLVRLYLAQIKLALAHHMLMHLLAMRPCPLPPILDRSLITN